MIQLSNADIFRGLQELQDRTLVKSQNGDGRDAHIQMGEELQRLTNEISMMKVRREHARLRELEELRLNAEKIKQQARKMKETPNQPKPRRQAEGSVSKAQAFARHAEGVLQKALDAQRAGRITGHDVIEMERQANAIHQQLLTGAGARSQDVPLRKAMQANADIDADMRKALDLQRQGKLTSHQVIRLEQAANRVRAAAGISQDFRIGGR